MSVTWYTNVNKLDWLKRDFWWFLTDISQGCPWNVDINKEGWQISQTDLFSCCQYCVSFSRFSASWLQSTLLTLPHTGLHYFNQLHLSLPHSSPLELTMTQYISHTALQLLDLMLILEGTTLPHWTSCLAPPFYHTLSFSMFPSTILLFTLPCTISSSPPYSTQLDWTSSCCWRAIEYGFHIII